MALPRATSEKQKNKEQMQQSTALYKQLNFSVSNIRKLKKSIRHSLQLIDQLHFDPDLTDRSWLYGSDGRIKYLLDIPAAMREDLADIFIQKTRDEIDQFKQNNQPKEDELERQKLTKVISARRSDLKSELSKDNYTEEQKTYIQNLLNSSLEINNKQPENYDLLDGTKARNIAKKLIELHNARTEKSVYKPAISGRTVVMQESFFKFPIHNQVKIEDHDYHAILTGYYTKYFPQYEIKMAVFHGNEKSKGEPDHNAHCHIFTSTRNKETQKYDFLDREIEAANAYAKANNLPEVENKTLQDMPLLGELRQKMFYEYAQQYLNEHKRTVELYFVPDTEQRREQRALIRKQAKLPKSDRFYNQLNHQREQLAKLEQEMIETQKQLREEQEQNEIAEEKLLFMQDTIKRDFAMLKIDAQSNHELWQKLEIKKAEVEQIRSETTVKLQKHNLKMRGILDNFTSFFNKVFNWTLAIISAEKVEAKDLKKEIETELYQLERTQKNDKLRDILDCAELIAEATEHRFEVEEKLKITPAIRKVNETARNKSVKPS